MIAEHQIDAFLRGWAQDPSLTEATADLERVIAATPSVEAWYAELRKVIHECSVAVEHELHDLCGDDSCFCEAVKEQPRLIPQIEHLKTTLSSLLAELEDASSVAAHPDADLLHAVRRLRTAMHHAADKEFDILHEWLVPIGGGD